MTDLAAFPLDRSEARGDVVRWSASLLLVLGLHAAAVRLFLHSTPGEALAPPSEAVMIDLAPDPVSPGAEAADTPPPEAPPHETQPALEPELVPAWLEPPPTEPVAAPPELPAEPATPLPEVELPAPPPPTPPPPAVRHPPRAQHPSIEPRREMAAPTVPAAAAPPPVPAALSSAVPTWQGLMLGRLQRFKRYPDTARSSREEGIAYLTFSMDRSGRVISASIARSSGSQALDSETLSLIHRAEPLPVPPPEMPGDPVTLTVPVRFTLQ